MPPGLDFDLREYWRIVVRRKAWGYVTFVGILGGVLFFTFKQSPVWEASAVVRVSSREPVATIGESNITWYGTTGGLGTEIEMIQQSDELHRNAASRLVKSVAEEVRPTGGLRRQLEHIRPAEVRGAITAEQISQSDLIRITATGPSRPFVARLADAVGEAYCEEYVKSKSLDAQKKRDFIKDSVGVIEKELLKVEDEARRTEEAYPNLGASITYRTRVAEIDVEMARLLERVTNQNRAVKDLAEQRGRLEAILRQIPRQEQTHSRLLNERERLRGLRDQLARQLTAADIEYNAKRESALQQIALVSKADRSAKKLRPNEVLNLGIGSLLGLVSAVVVCFLIETLDTSIGTVEDIEGLTKLPVMGLIPYLGTRRNRLLRWNKLGQKRTVEDIRSHLVCNMSMNSVGMESYRTLRENVVSALAKSGAGDTLLVTSAAPGEGKTLTCINLALVSVQMGQKVLLIEADMRNPRFYRFLAVPREPGLSDILLGRAPLEACTRGLVDLLMGSTEWDSLLSLPNIDRLHILTSGAQCPNPAEVMGSPAMGTVVERAAQTYDMVIVDTPPVLPVADSFAVAKHVRSAVVVYRVGGVSRHLLQRTLKLLQDRGVLVHGTVLNYIGADVQLPQYYYRYGYGAPYLSPQEPVGAAGLRRVPQRSREAQSGPGGGS